MKAYLVKIVKTYVFWSCVYLPYAWIFFSSLQLPVYLFPAGVLIALIYLGMCYQPVSYTHLRAHETRHDLVCRLLLEKKKN